MINNDYYTVWDIQLKKSMLPYIILTILNRQKCYGYLILTIIEDIMDFELTDGTLYPLLARLNNEELIEHQWVIKNSGAPRKYYSITEKGITYLNKIEDRVDYITKQIEKLK